ncbi:uncharacterized protein LOC122376055 isoform X3 [Amphibalanus amphitrite]|uniref:uncharacterized protein LOC122376055 isoform X3 n=1 Tax=Amphibalanus amphitrite TaxID=1232801 RepID=UPI001C91618D|nr:uncharacterized protein LOC122376055 isoform X3 [Amphibalanus amphitrite]
MERELAPLAPFSCAEPSKWDSWKRSFEYYIQASGITSESRKIALLLHVGGVDLQEVFHSVVDASVKVETLQQLYEVFDQQFLPKRNVIYERHVFRKEAQRPGETIDVFATRLRGLVRTCEYGSLQDEMVRDQIVDKCLSHRLRCHLLREQCLTLQSALTIARSMEDADRQAELMEDRAAEELAARAVHTRRPDRRMPGGASDQTDGRTKCFRCGKGTHDPEDCFAKNKKCHSCGRGGHYQRMCRGGGQSRPGRRQVRLVTTEHEDHVFRLADDGRDVTYPVQRTWQAEGLPADGADRSRRHPGGAEGQENSVLSARSRGAEAEGAAGPGYY